MADKSVVFFEPAASDIRRMDITFSDGLPATATLFYEQRRDDSEAHEINVTVDISGGKLEAQAQAALAAMADLLLGRIKVDQGFEAKAEAIEAEALPK